MTLIVKLYFFKINILKVLTCFYHFVTMLILVVVLFGEDVAFGGVFRCSNELKNKHGKYSFSHA